MNEPVGLFIPRRGSCTQDGMPSTQHDPTLELSRNISAVQSRCRAATRLLEVERWRALRELAGVAKALERHANDLDKASVTREGALLKARSKEEEAVGKARAARERAFEKAEREFRDADPYPVRREAEREAEREYRAALDEIDRTVVRLQQPPLRRKARLQLLEAKRKATRDYHRAGSRSLDRRRATQRDTLSAERAAIRAAQDAAVLAERVAERAHGAAVRQAARRLRAALSSVPEARQIETRYMQQSRQIRAQCRADEEALFEDFRRSQASAKAS